MMLQRKHFIVSLLAALVCGGASAQAAAPDAQKQLAAERFTVSAMIDKYVQVYRDVIGRRQ